METENTSFLMERRQCLHGAGGAAFALSIGGVAGMTELMAAA